MEQASNILGNIRSIFFVCIVRDIEVKNTAEVKLGHHGENMSPYATDHISVHHLSPLEREAILQHKRKEKNDFIYSVITFQDANKRLI